MAPRPLRLPLQTEDVVVLKVTVGPDEAEARTVTGDCARVFLTSGSKLIL